MATKRIKFIKAWQMVPVGAEREFDTPIADLLIQNGRAEEVNAASDPLEPTPTRTIKMDPNALKRALRKSKKGKR